LKIQDKVLIIWNKTTAMKILKGDQKATILLGRKIKIGNFVGKKKYI